ncbi:MAG: SoxR reducing system RseC family protein [Coriobacteriia bacterium]|nr:SoxR reducing system RseC family protein [Coriobacteriia bacterium]
MSAEFERGTVTAREGQRVEIRMSLSAKCEGCTLCDKDGGGNLVIRGVHDSLGANVGDTVEIEIPAEVKRAAAIALYVIPVAALLLGYLAGDLLGVAAGINRDVTGAIGAIGAAIVAFLGLRRRERAMSESQTSSPRVHAIIARSLERR